MWVHSLLLAFVMVFITALALTPIILFVMGFAGRGWSWVYGALLAAIIAPTDALAATAVLKQGGRVGACRSAVDLGGSTAKQTAELGQGCVGTATAGPPSC